MGITLLKLEPSAQIPWAKTMLGLASADMAGLLRSNGGGHARRYRDRGTRATLQACLSHPDTHPTHVANPFGAAPLPASTHWRMLTARATTITARERLIADWTSMVIFAQRLSGIA